MNLKREFIENSLGTFAEKSSSQGGRCSASCTLAPRWDPVWCWDLQGACSIFDVQWNYKIHFFALAWKSADFLEANGSEFERNNFHESVLCSFAVTKVEDFQSSGTLASSWDICVNLPVARCLFHCEFLKTSSLGHRGFLFVLTWKFSDYRQGPWPIAFNLQRGLSTHTLTVFGAPLQWRAARKKVEDFQTSGPHLQLESLQISKEAHGKLQTMSHATLWKCLYFVRSKEQQARKRLKILSLPAHSFLSSSWDLCVKLPIARCLFDGGDFADSLLWHIMAFFSV